jgi:glycosyltransferase involved in cell wall biosynthesis
MRIGLDARFLTHPQKGGFKTYTENLVAALAILDTKNEYVLYVDRPFLDQSCLPCKPNFECRVVSGLFPVVGMPWREQIGLVRQVGRDRIDLFHSLCLTAPLNLSCPLVITIHDMIWAFPEKYSNLEYRSFKWNLILLYDRLIPKYAIRNASAIITVSQSSKNDIINYLGLNPDRIFVTHEAAGSSFYRARNKKTIESIRQKCDLHSSYILALGAADPRKNIRTLVHAYSLLPDELRVKYKLAVVQTHHLLVRELTEQVDQMGLKNNIRYLWEVSNDDLAALYNAASLFVFPSFYEGFGLPPLEAMACGTPVIASNNSSIPEIVGDAALLFSAENAEELAELISTVLANPELQLDMRKRGIDRAATFSWKNCALETIEVYKKVFYSAKNG